MPELSKEEKSQLKKWLSESFQAVKKLDGSESSEEKVYSPLSFVDDFIRAKKGSIPSEQDEIAFVNAAFRSLPQDMPETVNGFLEAISDFYDEFRNASNPDDIWDTLQNSGAVVKNSNQVFVKTDAGLFADAKFDNANSYEVKTEPRLAMLIAHLRNDGIDGQQIYMDDLVITRGNTDPGMMRKHPYNIVQIPRLDVEISVCDQIGETTFVKRGTVGSEFWVHMGKDQLKGREDILHVDKHSEGKWWRDISNFISDNAESTLKKVNVQSWSNKKPNLDMELIDESLLAHRQETEEWLSKTIKGGDGKKGSYILEYGSYAGQLTASSLESNLQRGGRGLEGGSSIAKRNAFISEKHGLDYINKFNQEDFYMDLVDDSLLAHRQETEEWLSKTIKGNDGKKGSYILEYGSYAGMSVSTLEAALVNGRRGLEGGSSIAKRNSIISEKYNLDYSNHLERVDLDINLVDESLFAHRQATGEWLSTDAKGEDGKRGGYILEHGPYAGMTVGTLKAALSLGARGLEGGSSIAKRNSIISEKYNLDYSNHLERVDLDINLVDESLFAHRQATGEWLSSYKKGIDGKKGSYILEYGPYAGMRISTLEAALVNGRRGLEGGSSIAKRNAVISEKHRLDYIVKRATETKTAEPEFGNDHLSL